jgi:GNAT superfamily N-acetyltransferase
VRRTDAQHLVDPPTEVLAAAARLIRSPGELLDLLSSVLLDATVRHVEVAASSGNGFTARRMQIPGPDGGTLLVERAAPPFTPAEYARACALVDVAAEVRATSGVHWFVAVPDGSSVELRPRSPADEQPLTAMLGRCSDQSLQSRFPQARDRGGSSLRRAVGIDDVVAVAPDGSLVGMGSLQVDGTEADVALLVEDAWQRRGIGTAILHRLIEMAEDQPAGVMAVHAHSGAANQAMIRTMGRLDLPLRRTLDGQVMTVTADLRPAREAANSVVGALPRPL